MDPPLEKDCCIFIILFHILGPIMRFLIFEMDLQNQVPGEGDLLIV